MGNVLGTAGFHDTYQLDNYEGNCLYARTVFVLGQFPTNNCTTAEYSPLTLATLLRHANYDAVNASVLYNGADDRALPDSLYLASKPAFFGALPWPAIGPDLDPMVGTLPAKQRFDAMGGADTLAPAAPTNLTVQ